MEQVDEVRRNMYEVLQLKDDGNSSRRIVERRAKAEMKGSGKAMRETGREASGNAGGTTGGPLGGAKGWGYQGRCWKYGRLGHKAGECQSEVRGFF